MIPWDEEEEKIRVEMMGLFVACSRTCGERYIWLAAAQRLPFRDHVE
jgi:hypothetical protein